MILKEFIEILRKIEFKSVEVDCDTDEVVEKSVAETYDHFGYCGIARHPETLIIKNNSNNKIIKIYDNIEKNYIDDEQILCLTFVSCSIDLYQYLRSKKYHNSASSLVIYVE